MYEDTPDPASMIDLGTLLGTTVDAIIKAQDALDNRALRQKTVFQETPSGTIALPPLWFTMSNVVVELEMSAAISTSEDTRLMCRTVNPAMVGLYGYQASAGMRVRMQIGPSGMLPIKEGDVVTTEPPPPKSELPAKQ